MDNKLRIKTVSVVAGTETLVEMPHSHAYIRNIGEEKVYASTSPDIIPYDDGVIEIKPNRTKVLANIFDVKKGVGEIYLLSVGDTVCEIESTNVLNFSETVEGGDGSSSGSGSGENGKDGRGILKIAFLSSTGGDVAGIEGAVDTYQITYTDGTKSTYDVTNGSNGTDGKKGNGITEVVFESSTLGDTPSIAGSIDTYKIQFENGASTTFEVVNGINGEQGVSIVSVAINDDKHLVVEFSDGNTQDIGKLPQSDVDLTNYYTINETNDKINTEIQSSLENYVQKDGSKVLSTNDYTTVEKTKLANLTNYDDTEIKNNITAIRTTVDKKVDKVDGHSLVLDSEIEKLSAITNPIKVKGKVDSFENLPTGAVIGDLYFVGTEDSEDYKEYVLTESREWEQIGVSKIDLSNYVLKKSGYSLVSDTEITRLASVENYDDTQVKTDIINLQTIKANADEVYTIAQTNSAIATEVAKIVAEAPESLDTLKEISTWIATHEDSASAMNLQIQTNKTNIAKKVDKKDGYSLVADTEITRLADVHNYDDTNVKAQNYTTIVKSMTNTMCGFKFDASVNRFTAKFLMCGNNENRYADVFVNVCFGKAKIKKYILDNMTSIQIIKTEDKAINIVFDVEQYTTVTCVSTIPMTMITCYSTSTLPTGTKITPTEL